jgi:hypothetical protein
MAMMTYNCYFHCYYYPLRYDNKADLWSAGTVLFEMIAGRPPFHGENHIDLLRNIQQKAVRLPPDVRVSKECVNLLRILLNRNPVSRASFQEFIQASNAFVALGCNGSPAVVTDDNNNNNNNNNNNTRAAAVGFGNNLGPISEEEIHATADVTNIFNRTTTTSLVSSASSAASAASAASSNPNSDTTTTTIPSSQVGGGIRRNFSPLEPSPPGPRSMAEGTTMIPPLPQLPLVNANANQCNLQLYPMNNNNNYGGNTFLPQRHHQQQQQHQQQHPFQKIRRSELSQNSDDGEFVMVEKGSGTSRISPKTTSTVVKDDRSITRSPIVGMWKSSSNRRASFSGTMNHAAPATNTPGINTSMNSAPSSPVSPRSNSRFFTSKAILPSRNLLIPPSIPFFNKGILSTSPGTGGALVGMMGNTSLKNNAMTDRSLTSDDNGRSNKTREINSSVGSSGSNSFVLPESGVFNYQLFARMLATAEDVGRRAINVAHVGDTRAYAAMKLLVANENVSSIYSSSGTPMEGVIEEDDDVNDVGGEGAGFWDDSQSLCSGTQMMERGRAVSSDQTFADEENGSDNDDEDDEMPFAISSPEDDSNSIMIPKGGNKKQIQQQLLTPVIGSISAMKQTTRTSNASIQDDFRQALSCYIKSLTMLKGSVNASQRIIAELNSINGVVSSSTNERESINQFKKRCEASNGWLIGQFKGVLERAEAGKVEISKLAQMQDVAINTTTTTPSPSTSGISPNAITNVEELIYNHSLACGRDGAVKQLLGQHDAARSCYRSAGLLIETLLMEGPKLVDGDKKTLEGYVQGFAERINELDQIMLYQNKNGGCSVGSMVSSSGRGSSCIIPVIGGSKRLYNNTPIINQVASNTK